MSFKFIPLQFSLSQCFGLWLVVVSPKISRKLVFLPINLNKFVLLEVDTWKRSICETISHRILMFNVFHYKFNNQLKNIFCLHFQPFTVWYTTVKQEKCSSPYPCTLRAWAARLKILSDLYVADLETEESCTRFSELTVL